MKNDELRTSEQNRQLLGHTKHPVFLILYILLLMMYQQDRRIQQHLFLYNLSTRHRIEHIDDQMEYSLRCSLGIPISCMIGSIGCNSIEYMYFRSISILEYILSKFILGSSNSKQNKRKSCTLNIDYWK